MHLIYSTPKALKLQESVTQLTHDLERRLKELSNSQTQVHKLESELEVKSRQVCDLESRLDNLEDKSEGLMHGLTTRSSEVTAKKWVTLFCKWWVVFCVKLFSQCYCFIYHQRNCITHQECDSVSSYVTFLEQFWRLCQYLNWAVLRLFQK